jgi:hypothetical protein
MTRPLYTRLCLTKLLLLACVPSCGIGGGILPNRANILARLFVLVPVHALPRILVSVPAKIPVITLTDTDRRFVVSKIRMTNLPVLNS